MMLSDDEIPFLKYSDASQPALKDDGSDTWLSYGALQERADGWRRTLHGSKSLVFLYAHNDIASVAAFLGACAAEHAVALFDPALSTEMRDRLAALYRPEWTIDCAGSAVPQRQSAADDVALQPDLLVLVSTSGSTGSPKLVRLTMRNLTENACAIGTVLGITDRDIACGHLPLHYSFGLSVLTSHLMQGARIRLTKTGFTDRMFWPAMRAAEISHIPGVPFHFQMLQKLDYRRLNLPTLRSLTQAGGFLAIDARREAHAFMESVGGRFFVMYGQTEASPRMTTLTHEAFAIDPDSVGIALPGCDIRIVNGDDEGRGEVEFIGPNVMMGYAEARADLARGDELGGRLATGDIGYLRNNGALVLTGRAKRSGKIYGLRVNLDEIEAFANSVCETAVTQNGDTLVLHIVRGNSVAVDDANCEDLLSKVKQRFTLPEFCYRAVHVDNLPRTERAKIDYTALGSNR